MHEKFARKFYSTTAWKRTRAAYAESRGYLCERCLEHGLITPGTEVHHIRHLTPENIDDPSVTLDWANLMLLCEACHHDLHNADRHGERRWILDEDGGVVLPPPGGPPK